MTRTSRSTILPPSFACEYEAIPSQTSVAGYVAVIAKLERDAEADATDTVRPGRVAA